MPCSVERLAATRCRVLRAMQGPAVGSDAAAHRLPLHAAEAVSAALEMSMGHAQNPQRDPHRKNEGQPGPQEGQGLPQQPPEQPEQAERPSDPTQGPDSDKLQSGKPRRGSKQPNPTRTGG